MYRKMGANEDASAALDEVAARSKNYPGLALEQGLLMEISGNFKEALASYEKALARNPNDVGAKIRVAAASHLNYISRRPWNSKNRIRSIICGTAWS